MKMSTKKARQPTPSNVATEMATARGFEGGLGDNRRTGGAAAAALSPYRRVDVHGDVRPEKSGDGPTSTSADLLVGDATAAGGYELIYLLEGTADGVFGARHRALVAGDIVVIALDRPFVVGFAPCRRLTLRVPADRVGPEIKALRLHGLVLRAGAIFGRMIASVVLAFHEAGADPAGRPHDATLSFVLAMLHIAGAGASDRSRDDEEAGRLLDRAQALIERRIASPDLTPKTIAAELATSRAALYRAFEPFGGVSAVIRDMRLERSRVALALGRPRIAAVAFANGFRSEAQFSRAYKAKFKIQPSAVRQIAGSPAGSEIHRIREAMLGILLKYPSQ